MTAITITTPTTTHLIGQCQNCAWRTEDYRDGDAKARRHAKEWGHEVTIERGQVYSVKGTQG
jgi:hypothetical protein